jgi:hypothetical protein
VEAQYGWLQRGINLICVLEFEIVYTTEKNIEACCRVERKIE